MFDYLDIRFLNITIGYGECSLTIISLISSFVTFSFQSFLYLSNNKLTETVNTEIVNKNKIGILLFTCCLYHFTNFLWFIVLLSAILFDCLCIFLVNLIFEDGNGWLTNISPLQALWISYFKGDLILSNNQWRALWPLKS